MPWDKLHKLAAWEVEILLLYLHCSQLRGEIRRHLRGWEQEDFCLRPHRRLWAVITELEEAHLSPERLETITRGGDDDHDLADLPLPELLTTRLAMAEEEGEGEDRLDRFMPLLEPSELQRQSFHQPLLHLRGAIASRARLTAEKRCRHLLDTWQAERLHTLEQCLARLLEDEKENERQRERPGENTEPGGSASASVLDMETQLQQLFETLNEDALRLQAEYYAERRHLRDLDQHRRTALADIVSAP